MVRSCGIWILLIFTIVAYPAQLFRNRALAFLFVAIALFVIGYAGIFLLSVRELRWHLVAVPRILLIPSVLSMLYIAIAQETQE